MKNIVKYSNRLNMIGIRSMSKLENDVFFALIYKLKDQQKQEVCLTLTELKSLIGKSRQPNDYIQKALLNMAEKFSQFVAKYENDKKEKKFFSIFEVLTVPNAEPKIKAKLSNQFLHIANDLSSEYTIFDLAEYSTISSKYTQGLYRLLKQFSSTGYLKIAIEDFREKLNIPASYQQINIDTKILALAKNDFIKRKIFKSLTIQKVKPKSRGNKVTHLEFIFTPETKSNYEKLQDQENTTPKDTRYAESVANREKILENQKAKQQIKQHNIAALAADCNALKMDEPQEEREQRIKKEVQRMNMSIVMKKYALRTFSYKSNYYKIWNFEYNADDELVLFVKDEDDKIVRYNHTFKSCEHLDNYMKDYLT